jgi:benzodiazapine receptor
MSPTKSRLISILNALAYGLNALETSGFGPFSSGFTSGQDNASISQKYQTIITPHGIAFSIWGLIFISQAIFVLSTPSSDRLITHPLMVDGVSFWYVAVCLAQTAWSPAFAYEKILLSAVFMGLIFYSLASIVYRQYNLVMQNLGKEVISSRSDYWLLQFPFEIHFSWITAAFVLNLNILAVASGCNATTQAAMAVVSLVLLSTMSFICLKVVKRPIFTFPSVAAWATVSVKQKYIKHQTS